MAHTSSKIAPFPGVNKRPVPAGAASPETGDPTRELRAYIEGLQDEARQARIHQEAVEEDRDRLAEEVRRLQRELETAGQAKKDIRDLTVQRDGLLAEQEKQQVLLMELRRKADGGDRIRAQLESQRDEAMRHYKNLRKEADQHIAARDEAVRQRDAALRQRAQSLREQEELAARFADAQRQLAEAQRALVEAQSGLSKKSETDIQKQITSIRQARDSAAAQAADLKARIAELEDQVANLSYDRDVSDKTSKKVLLELDELRIKADTDAEKAQLMETLQAELAEVAGELQSLREQHASVQGAKDQLVAQLREFRETHEAMLVAQTSQIETTTKERDVLRGRLQERDGELTEVRAELAAAWAGAMQVTEPEIQRLTKELENMSSRAAEVDAAIGHHDELVKQREGMRLQVIELNAQLENARREIKEIGAALAEARLQMKVAGRGGGAAGALAKGAMERVAGGEPSEGAEDSSHNGAQAIKATKPAVDRVAAAKAAFQRWSSKPGNEELGWELAKEVTAFAGSSEAVGQQVLSRVGHTLGKLIEKIVEKGEAPSAETKRTIGKTIELLSEIQGNLWLDQKVRLTGARIHIVDDDVEVCNVIAQVLQAAGFVTECTHHPSGALAQLASNGYELLIFDVRLPEIDGFQLCGYVRGLEQHLATPIMFITVSDPAESQDFAGAEFLGKPFDPVELTLRAMRLIIQAQIETA